MPPYPTQKATSHTMINCFIYSLGRPRCTFQALRVFDRVAVAAKRKTCAAQRCHPAAARDRPWHLGTGREPQREGNKKAVNKGYGRGLFHIPASTGGTRIRPVTGSSRQGIYSGCGNDSSGGRRKRAAPYAARSTSARVIESGKRPSAPRRFS